MGQNAKMVEKDNRHEYRMKNAILAVIFVTIFYVILCHVWSLYYAVNDDLNFRDIFSGAYIGTPSYSLVIQWPVSSIFQFLYSHFMGIDFWAYYLVLSHFPCWVIWVERALDEAGNTAYTWIGICLILLVIDVPNVILFQFTTTATVYAVTGIVILSDKRSKNMIWAAIMFAMAFATRRENFIMIVPFIIVILCMRIYEEKTDILYIIKKQLMFVLILISLIGIFYVISYTHYHVVMQDEEYSEYRKIRETIYDYEGVPDWDTYPEFYKGLGISYGEYEAIRTHNTGLDFGKDISDILIQMSEFNSTIRQNQGSIEKVKLAIGRMVAMGQRIMVYPQVVIAIGSMGIVGMAAIYYKQYVYFLFLLTGFGGAWAEVLLLSYKSRMPERVFQSIMLVAIIWILTIYGRISQNNKRNRKFQIGINSIAIMGACAVLVFLLLPAIGTKQQEYAERFKVSERVRQYRLENQENIYFTPYNFNSGNTDTLGNTYSNVFDNTFRLGLGIKAPQYEEKLMFAGITESEEVAMLTKDNVYVMGLDKNDQLGVFHTYFQEKYGDRYYYEVVDILDETIYILKLGLRD